MQKIVYRPKSCSFETKIGQLDRIMKKKESFGKSCASLSNRKMAVQTDRSREKTNSAGSCITWMVEKRGIPRAENFSFLTHLFSIMKSIAYEDFPLPF